MEGKKRPYKGKEVDGVIEESFSQEYMQCSGSISNSQAQEKDIGFGDFGDKSAVEDQNVIIEENPMDIDGDGVNQFDNSKR
jgi:hypothetical protein